MNLENKDMSKHMDFYLLLQILVKILLAYGQKAVNHVKNLEQKYSKLLQKRARATGNFKGNKL